MLCTDLGVGAEELNETRTIPALQVGTGLLGPSVSRTLVIVICDVLMVQQESNRPRLRGGEPKSASGKTSWRRRTAN